MTKHQLIQRLGLPEVSEFGRISDNWPRPQIFLSSHSSQQSPQDGNRWGQEDQKLWQIQATHEQSCYKWHWYLPTWLWWYNIKLCDNPILDTDGKKITLSKPSVSKSFFTIHRDALEKRTVLISPSIKNTLKLNVNFLSPLSKRLNKNIRTVLWLYSWQLNLKTHNRTSSLVTFLSLQCHVFWTPFWLNFSVFKAHLHPSNLYSW